MCRFRAPIDLLTAWKRPLEAASRVRILAADRQAVEDDLLCHQSSAETAGLGRPTTRARAKLWLRKKSIALNPPLETNDLTPSHRQSTTISRRRHHDKRDRPVARRNLFG
jgi:hypothetical protein